MCTFNLYLLSQVPITVSLLKLKGVLYCRREGLGLDVLRGQGKIIVFLSRDSPFTGCPLSYSSPLPSSPSWLPSPFLYSTGTLWIVWILYIYCVSCEFLWTHFSSQISHLFNSATSFSLPLFSSSFSVYQTLLARYTVELIFKLHLRYKLNQNNKQNWSSRVYLSVTLSNCLDPLSSFSLTLSLSLCIGVYNHSYS